MLKSLIMNRRSLLLFSLMFGIICLLNINFCILRSARNALAVADLGHGASSIPFFELFGTMPGAVLMVFCLTRLLNRFSIYKVFLITLATFTTFFLTFALGIYPALPAWKIAIAQWTWLPGHEQIAGALLQGFSMLFFVMAELWKIALLTVLFWGLVNHYIPLDDAKKFYGPLMIGGSVGTILSGPLVKFCTSDFATGGSWAFSLNLMMGSLALIALLTAWLYTKLWNLFATHKTETPTQPEKEDSMTVWDSVKLCLKSKYLLLLAWLTIADYIAYTLGEVVFLDVLKQKFPDPRQYCEYQGLMTFWNGVLTFFSALVIVPYLVKKCRWVVSCLVTPICLLVTEGAFFIALWNPATGVNLELLVLLGTLFFCLVRAAKYTLFDTSKEISFLLLPPIEKMQGKLVIDGMCSRIGRGSASFVSITLIQLCGGVLASAFIGGWIAIGIGISCVLSTFKLGMLVDKRANHDPAAIKQ